MATQSVRLATRKTFQKIVSFEMFSCTHFIIFQRILKEVQQ
nr:MAG TPA: hypothetical protein [Caudoviricetes sp.]